jgi:hypothetical protein
MVLVGVLDTIKKPTLRVFLKSGSFLKMYREGAPVFESLELKKFERTKFIIRNGSIDLIN